MIYLSSQLGLELRSDSQLWRCFYEPGLNVYITHFSHSVYGLSSPLLPLYYPRWGGQGSKGMFRMDSPCRAAAMERLGAGVGQPLSPTQSLPLHIKPETQCAAQLYAHHTPLIPRRPFHML